MNESIICFIKKMYIMNCAESNSLYTITVKFGLQIIRVYPFCGENLERKGIADSDIEVILELSGNSG